MSPTVGRSPDWTKNPLRMRADQSGGRKEYRKRSAAVSESCQLRDVRHSFFGAVRGCHRQDSWKIRVVARGSATVAVVVVGRDLHRVFLRPFRAAVIFQEET